MKKLSVNQENLQRGIRWWLSETNWDKDFHNNFYKSMFQLGSVNRSTWNTLVDELVSWSAIRPVPKDEITKNGFRHIEKIDSLIRQLMEKHDLGNSDFTQVEWAEILELFQVANSIKNSSSPMFGSKLCHFILPKFFPIYDSVVGERVGTTDYRVYWELCREGWLNCVERDELILILQNQIGDKIHIYYPWASKITELCCHGGGVTIENNDLKNVLQVDSFYYSSRNSDNDFHVNRTLKVGDVLISHKGKYHHVCISKEGDTAVILWLNRKSGEPYAFFQYKREIRASNADKYYDLILSEQVNRSMYETPKNGWPA